MRPFLVLAGLACLPGVFAGGQANALPSGQVVWECREKGASFLKTAPRGAADGERLPAPVLRKMVPTPAGTILLWDESKAVELDGAGTVLREFPWSRVEGISFRGIRSVEPLADGGLLVASVAPDGPKGLVALVDREGMILRQVTFPSVLRSARLAGEGAFSALTPDGRIVEITWEGKTVREIPLPREYKSCTDMIRLEGGHYVVGAQTPALPAGPGETKSGRVAEFDADGRKVWEGIHGCPRSLQELPDGMTLVGAG